MQTDRRKSVEDEFRERQVRAVLEGIIDPCSQAAGTPLSLVDMGIVEDVGVHAGTVVVKLLPTFPACRFVPIFEGEVTKRLKELDWVEELEVRVAPPDVIWDESRLTAGARARLRRHRAVAKPTSAGRRGGHS